MQDYLRTKYDSLYMDIAKAAANRSSAKRLKVGACLVAPSGMISIGWNGTPSGFSNECENAEGITEPYVIHAERNVLKKLLRSGVSTEGSWLYITHSPCITCSGELTDIGLTRLVYLTEYRDLSGLAVLRYSGITVEKFDEVSG